MKKSHFLKAAIASIVAVSICTISSAQTKRLDHNFQLGMGISGSNSGDVGLATKLSYGLDIAISPFMVHHAFHWIPGIG